jgi:hypothetical protein
VTISPELSQEQMQEIFSNLTVRLAELEDGYTDDDIIDVIYKFFEDTDGSYAMYCNARSMKSSDMPPNISQRDLFIFSMFKGLPIAILFLGKWKIELGTLDDIREKVAASRAVLKKLKEESEL